MQGNLAISYEQLGRQEEALKMHRDVYCVNSKLYGEEHESTLQAATNYANSLLALERHGEAKTLLK